VAVDLGLDLREDLVPEVHAGLPGRSRGSGKAILTRLDRTNKQLIINKLLRKNKEIWYHGSRPASLLHRDFNTCGKAALRDHGRLDAIAALESMRLSQLLSVRQG
jgi:hypothetical protein